MSGNERESPTRGIGFESWKSTTGLCKEIWRRDYGGEIPEEVLRTVMKLTTAILEAQAARCRAEIATIFPGPQCAESSTHKLTRFEAPSSRSDSHDAQEEGSHTYTYSPRVSPVLAILATLDTFKLKRRWSRQFEADISVTSKQQPSSAPQPVLDILKSTGEDTDARETRHGGDDSEHAVMDRKKKKAVRFPTSPPKIIDSSGKSIIARECSEILSISIRNASATEFSQAQRKLNFHEELRQEENIILDIKREDNIDHTETRKRKPEDDSNAKATVVNEKKKKLEAVHPKKMPSKLSLKKKAHKSRQNASLGAKDIFADISIVNIDAKSVDNDEEANMSDTGPPTTGPYILVPQTEENITANGTPCPQPQPEQAVSTQGETYGDEKMTQALTPQYNISQPLTSPTHIDSSGCINCIDTAYDPKVADWLLKAPASNGSMSSSSSDFVRSPYYIDGITGEEISFDQMHWITTAIRDYSWSNKPGITTEPPATAIKILPPWPSRHHQQPECQPIDVGGSISVGFCPTDCTRPQAMDEDADKPFDVINSPSHWTMSQLSQAMDEDADKPFDVINSPSHWTMSQAKDNDADKSNN